MLTSGIGLIQLISYKKGAIQLYCEKERLAIEQFEQLETVLDIGDIVGSIKRTEKGELSVHVISFSILAKSLLPLPDRYHGLTDVDKRYRQRYVDMIANPEVADIKGNFLSSLS